jgi:hypothetical protein
VNTGDPIALFEQASTHAARVMSGVSPAQLRDPTPCSEWDVQQLIDHMVGWDLATATGQDAGLDPTLVDACIAMFLPDMPERGRATGLVGPAVRVAEDAPPQDRLLAAMGRRP